MSQACSEAPTPGGPAGAGKPTSVPSSGGWVTRPWLHNWVVAGAGGIKAQQLGGGGACQCPGSLPGA